MIIGGIYFRKKEFGYFACVRVWVYGCGCRWKTLLSLWWKKSSGHQDISLPLECWQSEDFQLWMEMLLQDAQKIYLICRNHLLLWDDESFCKIFDYISLQFEGNSTEWGCEICERTFLLFLKILLRWTKEMENCSLCWADLLFSSWWPTWAEMGFLQSHEVMKIITWPRRSAAMFPTDSPQTGRH